MTRVYNAASCAVCGTGFVRKSGAHKYCEECSEKRALECKRRNARNYARKNPPTIMEQSAHRKKRVAASNEFAVGMSAGERESITWDANQPIEFDWYIRVTVPFSYGYSKNSIFTMREKGHVVLRKEARALRDNLTKEIAVALHGTNIVPVPNKLWIDLLVQKTNHRGDAVNVIDLVCDGIKDGVGVDDRWFSIHRLDWQIVKSNPVIYVGIGQESREPVQCCHRCGRMLPYTAFWKSKNTLTGYGRECRECATVGRKSNKRAA